MMKGSTFAVVAIALFVGAYSLPVAEDTWSDQDEMLARVFSDASPVVSLLQADPDTVAHAEGEAASNADAAATAKADEEAYTAEEAKFEAKAHKLKEAEDALQAKAATDNAAASSAAAAYAEDAVAKSAAASKASADAEAAHQAAMAAYNKTLADLAAAGDAADQATKDRLAEEKATADKTAADLAAATAAGEQAAADLAASEKKLADAKAGIATAYASAMEDILAKNASNNAAMAKEAADWQATYASNQTSNAEKAAMVSDHLAAEKAKNEADAKQAMDDIDAKYAAKKAATDAAKADADAKALAASRADVQAHFAKIAADNQAEYEAKMAVADAMQADADAAHADYENALADSEAEQKAIDAMTANTVASDNEMQGCTTEQCLSTDGKCTDLKDESGTQIHWINSDDLVTCTDTPTGQYGAAYNAGAARAGIAAALTLAPIPAPSDECEALFDGRDTRLASFPASARKIIEDFDCKKDYLPLDTFICDPDLSPEQVQTAMKFFTEAGSKCPMWCVPGSETYTDDGVMVTHGFCLTRDDWKQFKEEVEDTPEYHNIGTVMSSTGEGRFEADNQWNKRMCTMAKSFIEGFKEGTSK